MVHAALAGLGALALAMGIGRFAFTPLLPLMQGDAGLSLAEGSYLAAANYVGYLLGALGAARPVRSALAVRLALLAIAVATAAMGVVHGMAGWLLLRFVAGVASAWALVHVSAWVLPRLAGGAPVLGGALYGGVGVGIALAGALCVAIARFGSADAWLALGAISLVVTMLLWPIMRDDGVSLRRASGSGLRLSSDAARLVACYGAFGFGYIIPATYVPAMAKALVPDPALFGWAWPLFGATAAVSTLVAAPCTARYGNRRVWGVAALAMALGVAAPVLAPGLIGVFAAAVLVGGTFMVITMAGLQEARAIGGAQAPQVMAAMTASFAAGQIAGPLVVSYLVHRPHGFAAALAIAAVALVASAIALATREKPCPT
jgi:MFS family permease